MTGDLTAFILVGVAMRRAGTPTVATHGNSEGCASKRRCTKTPTPAEGPPPGPTPQGVACSTKPRASASRAAGGSCFALSRSSCKNTT